MKTRLLSVVLVVAAMAALPALASGFNIYEQGAKASGQAVAWIARADSPDAGYYNPAAITKLEGTQVSFGISLVFVGESSIDIADPGFPYLYEPGKYDMEDNTGLPPHIHITHKFEGTPWAISGSLTAPFGLKTEWSEDFGGRFSARTSDLSVPMLSVNLAREFAPGWSASFGLTYAHADLKEFSRNVPLFAVPLPTTGLPVPEDFAFTPIVSPFVTEEPLTSLEGDGDDIGYQMALHYSGETWSFGAVYRSGFDIDLDGDIVFLEDQDVDVSPMIPVWTNDLVTRAGLPSETAGAIAAGYAAGVQASLDESLSNRGAFGVLNLPATWGIGLAYKGVDRWEFEVDYAVINWSDFEEIDIQQENGDRDVIEENWKDTSSWRFGAQYEVAERHIIGAGAYTETNVVRSENLRPSIPDGKREGYTLGYGYHGDTWGVDFYYMYIQVEDRKVDFSDYLADPSVVPGEYESEVTLMGGTVYFKF